MIVKICGIKTIDDGITACEAGADMLGFNFYPPSPRYIEPANCRQLVRGLRLQFAQLPVLAGVFVNVPASEIAGILDGCGLDLAQLHGDEAPDALDFLRGRAFKAIRPRSAAEAADLVRTYRRPAAGPEILFDAPAPGLYGGSGLTGNWALAASLARKNRLLLAGGLHPGNVAEAVAIVRPWGVDVASGVESSPGVKDPAKMRLFAEQARTAAANNAHSGDFAPDGSVRKGRRD